MHIYTQLKDDICLSVINIHMNTPKCTYIHMNIDRCTYKHTACASNLHKVIYDNIDEWRNNSYFTKEGNVIWQKERTISKVNVILEMFSEEKCKEYFEWYEKPVQRNRIVFNFPYRSERVNYKKEWTVHIHGPYSND